MFEKGDGIVSVRACLRAHVLADKNQRHSSSRIAWGRQMVFAAEVFNTNTISNPNGVTEVYVDS